MTVLRIFELLKGEYSDQYITIGYYATPEAAMRTSPGEWSENEPGRWSNGLDGGESLTVIPHEVNE